VKARANEELMITWVNTAKGEVYEVKGESPKHEMLYQRREIYNIGSVPRGVHFISAAADIQKDRIEVECIGWGPGLERWSIEHKVLPGNVQESEVWDALQEYLATSFKHVDGFEIPILMAGIDSGYETQRVYNFCKRYPANKVIPIRGQEQLKIMVGTPSAVDLKGTSGKKRKRGVRLWPIGVNIIKSELYGDLMHPMPDDIMDGFPGGFIHFPQYDMEYFQQLTAEKKEVKKDKRTGKIKTVWKKTRERNEILDLHVYNRAIAFIVGADRLKESGWERLLAQQKLAQNLQPVDNERKEKVVKRKKRERSTYWD